VRVSRGDGVTASVQVDRLTAAENLADTAARFDEQLADLEATLRALRDRAHANTGEQR
jgi:hypothetical protein